MAFISPYQRMNPQVWMISLKYENLIKELLDLNFKEGRIIFSSNKTDLSYIKIFDNVEIKIILHEYYAGYVASMNIIDKNNNSIVEEDFETNDELKKRVKYIIRKEKINKFFNNERE